LSCPRDTLYPQKLALTSHTSGGGSVGIVRLRTKAREFRFRFKMGVNKTPSVMFIHKSLNTPKLIVFGTAEKTLCIEREDGF
jgi:hypothetical protein